MQRRLFTIQYAKHDKAKKREKRLHIRKETKTGVRLDFCLFGGDMLGPLESEVN